MKTEYEIGDTLHIGEADYTLLDAEMLGFGNFGSMLLKSENDELFIWKPGNTVNGFSYVLSKPYRNGGFIDVYYDGNYIYQGKDGEVFVDKYPVDYGSFVSEQVGDSRLSASSDMSLDFSIKFTSDQLNELANISSIENGENSEKVDVNNADMVEEVVQGKNENPIMVGSLDNKVSSTKVNNLSKYTFVADFDGLLRISKILGDYADSIKGFVTDIYSIIDEDLANAWQGETYQMFSEMCHGYQNTINDLNVLLYAFSDIYKNAADQTEVLHDNIKQIIDFRLGVDVDGN